MESFIKKIKAFICLPFIFNCLYSQVFINDAGQREKHFIYEVKQIDEFFERFNNDTASFIKGVYKSYKVKYNLDRPKLIKSLFNYETKAWDPATINLFVTAAMQVQMPNRYNFYGDDWFAEANCKFKYNATTIEIPVILKIITDDTKRSKWAIVAVKENFLKASPAAALPVAGNRRKKRFIDPSSHGNNFVELEKDLDDKDNLEDYFDPAFFSRKNAGAVYDALSSKKLKLLYVRDIKYHFLQVDQYIFTVEYFHRSALNAGWLINSLRTASRPEKENYIRALLGD
jgi:hypothetical protein